MGTPQNKGGIGVPLYPLHGISVQGIQGYPYSTLDGNAVSDVMHYYANPRPSREIYGSAS